MTSQPLEVVHIADEEDCVSDEVDGITLQFMTQLWISEGLRKRQLLECYIRYGGVRDKKISLIENIHYLRFCFIVLDVQLSNPLPMNRKDVIDRQLKALCLHSGGISFIK
jgi:hypothetical protein